MSPSRSGDHQATHKPAEPIGIVGAPHVCAVSVWSLCICIYQQRKQRGTLNHTIALNQAIHQLANTTPWCTSPLTVVPARATLSQMQHRSLPQRQSTHGWPLRSQARQLRAAPQHVRATAGGTVPAAGAAPAFTYSKEKEIKPGVFEG